MLNLRWRPQALWTRSESRYVHRVLDLHTRRHRDDLLGLGYDQFLRQGRGVLLLQCRYRELFFAKGFSPTCCYVAADQLYQYSLSHLEADIRGYDPSTEVLVSLQVSSTGLACSRRVSKRGASLAVLHRQYLNRLLDCVVASQSTQRNGIQHNGI